SVAMRAPINIRFVCKSRCSPLNLPADFKGRLAAANWKATPTAAEVEAAYPKAAQAAHITGKVMLFCRLRADGGVRDCTATSEEPKGAGFAEAALSLTERFKVNPNPA